ncbi:MAG: hypothetical protein ABI641_08900, partial [Caldimonas sp.]
RAAIESLFGLSRRGDSITLTPRLPSHWDQAELLLTRGGRTARILFARPSAVSADEQAAELGARWLAPGAVLEWSTLEDGACRLVHLARPGVAETPATTERGSAGSAPEH